MCAAEGVSLRGLKYSSLRNTADERPVDGVARVGWRERPCVGLQWVFVPLVKALGMAVSG